LKLCQIQEPAAAAAAAAAALLKIIIQRILSVAIKSDHMEYHGQSVYN
jgi:hypothetical protein